MTSTSAFVDACRHAIGADHVLTASPDTAPFLTDWRRRYQGAACAVLTPANTEEVAARGKLALEPPVALVPPGGNSGLAG
ncbi:hydroxyacid dehydrogenase, partial [Burkholderia pseudomallei]